MANARSGEMMTAEINEPRKVQLAFPASDGGKARAPRQVSDHVATAAVVAAIVVAMQIGSMFIPSYILPSPVADWYAAGGAIGIWENTSEVQELAAFGEATWHVTDALKLTGGLRYSSLKRDVLNSDQFASLINNGPVPTPVVVTHPDPTTEHPVTPKFSVSYDFADGVMIYGTAAKGFREGGPNPTLNVGSPDCQAGLALHGFSAPPAGFESDSLWSYELGAKGQNADHTLRAQGAVYQIDWSNIQQSVNMAEACGNAPVLNLGKATIQGLEGEVSWRVSEGLTLDAAANYYMKAEISEDQSFTDLNTGVSQVGVRKGTPLASVPDFTATAAAQYNWRLADDQKVYVRAEYQYIAASNRYVAGAFGDNPGLHAESYDVASVRAGLSVADYDVNLFIDNLFDAHPIVTEGGGFSPGGNDGRSRSTIRPRTIGVSLARDF